MRHFGLRPSAKLPEVRTVIVDANAIVKGSWLLASAPWRLLRYRGRAGLDELVVPEVVVREVVGGFRSELTSISDRAKAVSGDFRRLGISVPTLPDLDVAHETEEYEQALRSVLADAKAGIPEPPVGILDLADRAIGRVRPFNAKGAGFRDATIWEHVVFEAARRWRYVALVSNDGCFGSGEDLHPDLKYDLARRAPHSQVRWFRTVDEYIRAIGTSDPRLAAEVTELVEHESEQLACNVMAAAEGMRWRTSDPYAEVLVEAAHQPVAIRVAGVTVTEEAPKVLVDLEVEVDADIFVQFWDREDYGEYVSGTATLSAGGSISYDPQTRTLDDLELGEPWVPLEDWLRRNH